MATEKTIEKLTEELKEMHANGGEINESVDKLVDSLIIGGQETPCCIFIQNHGDTFHKMKCTACNKTHSRRYCKFCNTVQTDIPESDYEEEEEEDQNQI